MYFDTIEYFSIVKDERYVAPLFDKYHDTDYSSESDENDDPFRRITSENKNVQYFFYDA